MTIAIGLPARDGILIGADTQITVDSKKFDEPKIFRVPAPAASALFSYSGNSHLAVAAIQKCEYALEAAKSDASHESLVAMIAGILEREFRAHFLENPDRVDNDYYDVLVALRSRDKKFRLYSTYMTSMRRNDSFACLGIGQSLADLIISSMYSPLMSLEEVKIVAAYALAKCKASVDGCGGATSIQTVNSNGDLDFEFWSDVKPLQEGLEIFETGVRFMLFSMLTKNDPDLKASVHQFAGSLRQIRRDLGIDDGSRQAQRAASEQIIANLKEGFRSNSGDLLSPESTKGEKSRQRPSQD